MKYVEKVKLQEIESFLETLGHEEHSGFVFEMISLSEESDANLHLLMLRLRSYLEGIRHHLKDEDGVMFDFIDAVDQIRMDNPL